MSKTCNGCETTETKHSEEWSLSKELAKSNKRMFIILLTVLTMWFTTIGIFVWYLYQYDYASYEVQQDGEWGNTFIDGGNQGDINYGAENIGEKEAEEKPQG